MQRLKCLNDRTVRSGAIWPGRLSPVACSDWGYCRNRNIEAGGMKNVTPEMQAEWRKEDQAA